MFDDLEHRLRAARFELAPDVDAREQALSAVLGESERPGKRTRSRTLLYQVRSASLRSSRLTVALVVAALVVAVGAVVWVSFLGSSSSPSVVAGAGGSDRFPSETLTDWVSYGDQVSVVYVSSERSLPAQVIEPGDSYIPRVVTLRIAETVWRRTGAPHAGRIVQALTYGWALKDGKRRPIVAWGTPRLAVGARYVTPLVRAPRDGIEWTPLSDGAILPLDGDVMTTAGIAGQPSAIAERLAGTSIQQIAAMLARTPPDPIAAKYFNLPPDKRVQAVFREGRVTD